MSRADHTISDRFAYGYEAAGNPGTSGFASVSGL
jgi:hypothetical protein